jgi:hypothetical protein
MIATAEGRSYYQRISSHRYFDYESKVGAEQRLTPSILIWLSRAPKAEMRLASTSVGVYLDA